MEVIVANNFGRRTKTSAVRPLETVSFLSKTYGMVWYREERRLCGNLKIQPYKPNSIALMSYLIN
jgi:hypothetical protein